jgi:hypothetical protein
MAIPATDPRDALPRRPGAAPVRPSGVMPAFRGSVSLPAPARPPLRLAPARELDDDALWSAALVAAKQRAEREEEERAWLAAMERAKALVAAQEEREWAALRARAARWSAPRPSVCTWP